MILRNLYRSIYFLGFILFLLIHILINAEYFSKKSPYFDYLHLYVRKNYVGLKPGIYACKLTDIVN